MSGLSGKNSRLSAMWSAYGPLACGQFVAVGLWCSVCGQTMVVGLWWSVSGGQLAAVNLWSLVSSSPSVL